MDSISEMALTLTDTEKIELIRLPRGGTVIRLLVVVLVEHLTVTPEREPRLRAVDLGRGRTQTVLRGVGGRGRLRLLELERLDLYL